MGHEVSCKKNWNNQIIQGTIISKRILTPYRTRTCYEITTINLHATHLHGCACVRRRDASTSYRSVFITRSLLGPPYLGAGQMTVTPTADGGGIIYINLEYYTTTDGSCGTLQTNPIVSIAQNFGGTTLLANHPYTTTGASNYFVFVTNSNPHTTDVKFYFSTNGTTALGNKSGCVPLSQMTCTGSTCDFGNPVVWSWTP